MVDYKSTTIGFIGTGNMAYAMIKGILSRGILNPDSIYAYDIDGVKLTNISTETHIRITENAKELLLNASIIIIAVKPNILPEVLNQINEYLNSSHVLVSIAAGVTIKNIQRIINNKCFIVRAMPNTPALVGEGMTALSFGPDIDKIKEEYIKSIFSALGSVECVEEKFMSSVTAISGSSPAYAFLFIEALADGGVLSGLPRDISYKMAAQSVLGAAKMILELDKHPGILKDMVASPGGTTIEAIYSLEKNNFRGTLIEAVKVCKEKADKLDNGDN